MEELLNNIIYSIDTTEIKNNSAKYKVNIKIPLEVGWIDGLNITFKTTYNQQSFQLHYKDIDDKYVTFENEIELETKAIYHYYFSFEANKKFMYYKKNNNNNTNSISDDDMWKLSVNFKVPDWAKGKIMYHIFVDRFNRGNKLKLQKMKNRTIHDSWREDVVIGPNEDGIWNADFYGGDIQGIIDKLDYIKSLGVSIIYLSPIVWSQSNHRYDAADYEKVDPYAGTNEDLKKLCDKAHEYDMKIVLDAVFNHTGNDSKYFNEYGNYDELGAYQSRESKYFPFYRKYFNNDKIYFDYWWNMTNLPVCDGTNKEWQNYIYGENGVIDLWFSLGIDGLRLDVADELTDEFIEGIRSAVKRNKEDGFIIGEVWKNPMRMGRGYLESGKSMDSVMNYTLIDALIRYFKYEDVHKLKDIIKQLVTEYPNDTLNSLMNFTSTHDITRAINIFATNEFKYDSEWAWNFDDNKRNNLEWQKNYLLSYNDYKHGKEIYKAYVFLLTFFPGILSIFYGDEIGIQGMGNLANRRPYPWNNQDIDLLQFFKHMGQIRNNEKFLENAELEIIDINSKYILFKRNSKEESAFIAVNRSGEKLNIPIPDEYKDIEPSYILGNSNTNELDSHGALVLKKKKDII